MKDDGHSHSDVSRDNPKDGIQAAEEVSRLKKREAKQQRKQIKYHRMSDISSIHQNESIKPS